MSNFPVFAKAVKKRFEEFLKEETLYFVNAEAEMLWTTYLLSFPNGSNPIFRKNTEYDCSCCRHFIKHIGNVVAIQNGAIATLWNLTGLPEPYDTVAKALHEYVSSMKVRDVFLTKESKYGRELTQALIDGEIFNFNHFCVNVDRKFVTQDKVEKCGEFRTTFNVLKRGMEEITSEALNDVLSLVDQNSLYRGEESKKIVEQFKNLHDRYHELRNKGKQELILWQSIELPFARLKNSAIGTLLEDLSLGEDLEVAVRKYDNMVAPQNYRRSSSLITKGMINDAVKKLQELDLEDALERRHAHFSDVDINSVLFVDNSVSEKFKGGIKNLLLPEAQPEKANLDYAKDIKIADFVSKVLPKTKSIKLLVENKHASNFVCLTAPVHADSKKLFKWDNNFAWSYAGNVTDAIKERVKAAGGMVENVIGRVSLAWNNYDDLDLHVILPNRQRIFFGYKINHYYSVHLDVDQNAGRGTTRTPVENIRWQTKFPDGQYTVIVKNFNKRESIDVGFSVQIENAGTITDFVYNKAVAHRKDIGVCKFTVENKQIVEIVPSDPEIKMGTLSKEVWGVKTQELVQVNSIVLSPNYWYIDKNELANPDNPIGAKHWFFILQDCLNPDPTRGIYNEFLRSNLQKHRKVSEVLGEKTKCQFVKNQMAGLGFSLSRNDAVKVVVTGEKSGAYNILF